MDIKDIKQGILDGCFSYALGEDKKDEQDRVRHSMTISVNGVLIFLYGRFPLLKEQLVEHVKLTGKARKTSGKQIAQSLAAVALIPLKESSKSRKKGYALHGEVFDFVSL